MFEFAAEWEMPINILFLAATGAVAWHGVCARNADGSNDTVHLLFGCIAAVFFMLVLFRDVLGVVNF